ncbi:MAG: VWA domain-containing protein [Tatlockia sp.]|nr:VWA domain-containing protein [Tatlockia sp.]
MKNKQEIEWKTLFDALLNAPYELELTIDKVILKVDSAKAQSIKDSLENKLGNTSIFWKNFPYQTTAQQLNLEQITKPVSYLLRQKFPENKEEALVALQNLLGDSINELGSLDPEHLNFAKGVLSFKAVTYAKRNILKEKATWLMLHFANTDKNSIGLIWGQPNQYLQEPDENLSELKTRQNGLSEGLLTQCFRIEAFKEKNQAYLVLDLGLLHQLIYPAEIKLEASQNENHLVQIEIDRRHLFNNIRQLATGEFLLRIYRNENDIKARVLLFNSDEFLPKEHTHVLLIDKSISMQESYEDKKNGVRQQLDKFLKVLQKEDPYSKIRLVFFSDKVEVLEDEFSIQNLTEIKKMIADFTQELGGGTALFEACVKTFNSLNDFLDERSLSITLFTDGMNNIDNFANEDVIACIDKIPYKNRPKITTIGIGDYDAPLLSKMANEAGGQFIHLNNTSTLKTVLIDNIAAMSLDRRLVEFIHELDNQVNIYNIPLLENEFSVPEIILPISFNQDCIVTIDNKRFPIQIKPEQVPQANTTDKLAGFAAEQTQLVSEAKLNGLKELKKEFANYKVLNADSMNHNDIQYSEQIERRIKEGIFDLEQAQNNERSHESIKSVAHGRAGFYPKRVTQLTETNNQSGATLGL